MTLPSARLEPDVFVSGQIDDTRLRSLAEQGFALVVNHRPDNEEPGQPASSELERTAHELGLAYRHVPVRGMPDDAAVAATAEALAALPVGKRALMFCRSGMRSSSAWALTRRAEGLDPDVLRAAAAAAGYDLSRLPL